MLQTKIKISYVTKELYCEKNGVHYEIHLHSNTFFSLNHSVYRQYWLRKIITDLRIRSKMRKGSKYRFPLTIDFKNCREEIAGVLQELCNR